eukprot:366320-Chlamydomonas_euryale.AAC.13
MSRLVEQHVPNGVPVWTASAAWKAALAKPGSPHSLDREGGHESALCHTWVCAPSSHLSPPNSNFWAEVRSSLHAAQGGSLRRPLSLATAGAARVRTGGRGWAGGVADRPAHGKGPPGSVGHERAAATACASWLAAPTPPRRRRGALPPAPRVNSQRPGRASSQRAPSTAALARAGAATSARQRPCLAPFQALRLLRFSAAATSRTLPLRPCSRAGARRQQNTDASVRGANSSISDSVTVSQWEQKQPRSGAITRARERASQRFPWSHAAETAAQRGAMSTAPVAAAAAPPTGAAAAAAAAAASDTSVPAPHERRDQRRRMNLEGGGQAKVEALGASMRTALRAAEAETPTRGSAPTVSSGRWAWRSGHGAACMGQWAWGSGHGAAGSGHGTAGSGHGTAGSGHGTVGMG